MMILCVLLAILTVLAGFLALLIHCVRNIDPEELAEALREEELDEDEDEEDECMLKGDRHHHTFNVDGSLMVNRMVDVRGRPYGVSGD